MKALIEKANSLGPKITKSQFDELVDETYGLSTEEWEDLAEGDHPYVSGIARVFSNRQKVINEMPDITKSGKTVYANGSKLKDLQVLDVMENIVVILNQQEGIFSRGLCLVYFMDTAENAQKMKYGKIPYLMTPRGTFMTGGSPITDIWKKRFQRPGTESILGHIEAFVDLDDTSKDIYIDMMTVRPGYRRNRINSLMIDALRKSFQNRKVTFSKPTSDGSKFIKKYTS